MKYIIQSQQHMLWNRPSNWHYRHAVTYAIVGFQTVQHKSKVVQIRTECTYGQIHVWVQGSATKNQPPAHLNLTASRMSTPLPPQNHMFAPSSIIPPPSSHCPLILARKHLEAHFKNIISLSLSCISLKLGNFKLCKLGSVHNLCQKFVQALIYNRMSMSYCLFSDLI